MKDKKKFWIFVFGPAILAIVVILLFALLVYVGRGSRSSGLRNIVDDALGVEHNFEIKEGFLSSLYYFYHDEDYQIANTEEAVRASKSAIYQLNTDISGADKEAAKLTALWWDHYRFFGAYQSNTQWLVGHLNILFVANLETGKTKELFRTSSGRSMGGVVASHNGNYIAYSLVAADYNQPSALYLWDTKTKEHMELAQPGQMLYGGTVPVGWSENDRKIYVRVAGGDGPGRWGDLYYYDLDSPDKGLVKITTDIARQEDLLFGDISPDGNYIAYTYCANPESSDEIGSWETICPDGEEIYLYSLKTGTDKAIYKNKLDGFARDTSRLIQGIGDIGWQNDTSLLFSNTMGITRLTLKQEEVAGQTVLYEWNSYDLVTIAENPASFWHIGERYIVFGRYNDRAVSFVIDTTTGKVREINYRKEDVEDFFSGRTQ